MAYTALAKTIVDGDTFYTAGGSRIRLNGVDTPEKGQRGYQAAKDHLTRLIGGRTVIIQVKARDVYGRSIAEVWRSSDRLHINAEMKKYDKRRVLLHV